LKGKVKLVFLSKNVMKNTILMIKLGSEELFIIIIIAFILGVFFIRKRSNDLKNSKADNRNNTYQLNTENKILIPNTCPHCKNPNPKRVSLCDWCGNQIC
jgi:hypothetical protein